MFGIVLMLAGMVLLVVQCTTSASGSNEPALFYIGGSGEQVSQHPAASAELRYTVAFDNPADRTFVIHKVEPIVREEWRPIVIGEVKPIRESLRLKPGRTVEYGGAFQVDTSGLTEEEIQGMLPVIEGYKLTINRSEEIVLPVKTLK